MRIAARTDGNQRGIVDTFKKAGVCVCDLHAVGHGVPDLAVGFHGKMYFVEVKSKRRDCEGNGRSMGIMRDKDCGERNMTKKNKRARQSFRKLLNTGKTGVIHFGTYKCSLGKIAAKRIAQEVLAL